MRDSPATRHSLLVRIRDARDNQAWSQFVDIYAPLIFRFARRHGLQDADAADLSQDVLRTVVRAAPQLDYDPTKGSFRGWLFTVVRNRLRDWIDSQRRHPRGSGDTGEQELLEAQPDRDHEAAAQWDREYQRRLFSWAAEQVRIDFDNSSWRAFWATAVEGTSPKDVAAELGMSLGAVYIAKSRVLARLKEKIRQFECDEV